MSLMSKRRTAEDRFRGRVGSLSMIHDHCQGKIELAFFSDHLQEGMSK